MGENSKKNESGHKRREFIKLATAGVAGSLAACSTAGLQEEIDETATLTPGGISKNTDTPAPDVGALVDPEFLQAETWQEPWTWRPDAWPRDSLELNVVSNQNPGISPSPGNPNPAIFSFNGASPGPTIRVSSDGELRLKVRNQLGQNYGDIPVGHFPDTFDLPPNLAQEICSLAGRPPPEDPNDMPSCFVAPNQQEIQEVTGHDVRPNWNIGGHINALYQAHTTNIHTHGLHVFPQTNPDGSHSDNIFLRIIPQGDFDARAAEYGHENVLLENEHVGQLDYRYQLSFEHDDQRVPHPPGTHWYHPHAHGSTHDQVSSGMAGYLIVEGDVDEAINTRMTGKTRPDPELSTGLFDYRERLIFIQRAFNQTFDNAAPRKKVGLRFPPLGEDDQARPAGTFRMRPGAIERWRVLNGSVDGAGTKRFMVVEGQFVQRESRLWRVHSEGERRERKRWLEPVSDREFEDAKLKLHQLSFDGITLVKEENGTARHWIKDLSRQNTGTKNPFSIQIGPGETEMAARLRAFESVWKDGDSLRNSFVRPNEVYLTNANRTDLLLKAPLDAAGKVFTILAREAHIHNDNMQQRLQGTTQDPDFLVFRNRFDVVLGYIHVTAEPVEGGDFDIQTLEAVLPPVPPILQPIGEHELVVKAAEAQATGVTAGSKRTRTISYSGFGGTNYPTLTVPEEYALAHPELEKLTWIDFDNTKILLQNFTGTMAINTEFDLAHNPDPEPPRKFSPHDPLRSKVLLDTAEEWVLYNTSMTLWGHTDRVRFPQPGSYNFRYESFAMTRAEGQSRFSNDPEFQITNRSTDHPFHIHINPMWVLRIDVPDENDELHNILPEPMWMDTVNIPRNGGRVVFRSRFEDFTGMWINHCHILQHEDNGMMQSVECTEDPSKVNYRPRSAVASHDMSADKVNDIYPRPSLELMYRQNMTFVDPSDVGGYEFPGFEFEIPKFKGS